MSTTERVYRWLVRLYPQEIRRHADEMWQVVSRRRTVLVSEGRPWPRTRLWAFILSDLARTLPATHLARLRDRSLTTGARSPKSGGLAGSGWTHELGELWRDFRIGLRLLARGPGVTVAAVATLALGIGGTTAMISVVDDVLLHPTNFPESKRLIRIAGQEVDGDLMATSYQNFLDLQREASTLEAVGIYRGFSVGVTGMGEPERIRGEFVTASYFDVLGARPALGRLILPGEDVVGGEHATVLSHGYWERRFGSDPSILGRTIDFNDVPHTIVGVMPPEFTSYWDATEAWISLHTMVNTVPDALDRESGTYFTIARLAEGVDPDAADRDLDGVMARLGSAHPEENEGLAEANVRTMADAVVSPETKQIIWLLSGAAVLVLLIATANVAGLQVARALQRSREMAIRGALGGGRVRLLKQLLVENLTLAALGGTLGIGVAVAAIRVLTADASELFLRFEVGLSGASVAAALLVTLVVGLLAGIVPALQASAGAPGQGLREGGRSSSSGRGSSRLRSLLVVGQMATAVTLLVGASLMLRTALALNQIELGFEPEGVLTAETRLTAEEYQEEDARRTYLQRVTEALRAVPGVRSAALIKGMPFAGDDEITAVRPEGSTASWDEAASVYAPPVSGGYFELMGIPLVEGRLFRPSDGPGAEPVVVISRNVAESFFPGRSAVGGLLETPEGVVRVAGVVENTRESISTDFQQNLYVHLDQAPPEFFSVLIRTEGAPATFRRAMLDAFWSIDPDQPLWEVLPLGERTADAMRDRRFLSTVLGGFAGLALILAALGLYGVMAYSVNRRRRELGVRIALGAEGGRIVRTVLRRGVILTVAGAAVGVVGAAAVSRLLAAALFGVQPFDSVSFVAAPAVLALVALAACYLPARSATRVDPIEAMRS